MKEEIFHRLYDDYHQDLFRFLIYLTKNRTVAEDLSHEVYVRVLKAYDRFESKSSEKTWLLAIAKNVALDHFRKQNVRRKHQFEHFDWETEQLISDQPSPEFYMESKDDAELLMEQLDRCTGDQKMVVILRYYQQLSIAETAAVLGWTESKVKTTQHRALKRLKALYKEVKEEASSL